MFDANTLIGACIVSAIGGGMVVGFVAYLLGVQHGYHEGLQVGADIMQAAQEPAELRAKGAI